MAGKKPSVEEKIDALTNIIERGFFAVAGDVTDLCRELNGNIAAGHDQISSIECQLPETRTEVRLSSLEEKVFGAARR